MSKKNQSDRLTIQHKDSHGVEGIFGKDAKLHDLEVGKISQEAMENLKLKFPQLEFRYRKYVKKTEINKVLNKLDADLGREIYVVNASIKPDGGLIEIKDDSSQWRIILVSEAKHQGKDIENIKNGVLVGKSKNKDLMLAGNAIERSHKNIAEIGNLMLAESYFPYIIFLKGSNFLTEDIKVARPDGRIVELKHNVGSLNRIDRITSANYGMSINKNLCENKFIKHNDKTIMLQAASIYTRGDGGNWDKDEMLNIMVEVAETSIKILATDLFNQLTSNQGE